MSTVATPYSLAVFRDAAAPKTPSKRRFGRLRRWLNSIQTARQRRAEFELAYRFGLTGGHLTDEIERRISEHLIRNSRL